MIRSLAFRFARPLSIYRSLRVLSRCRPTCSSSPRAPKVRSRLPARSAARGLALITRGPITSAVPWPMPDCLRTAAELSQAFVGQPALPRTIISYPDQLPCITSTSVMVPFLQEPHAFSTLEALLVMRHKPRVFALSFAGGRRLGFRLIEVHYNDAFDADGQLISCGSLVGRLLLLARNRSGEPATGLAGGALPAAEVVADALDARARRNERHRVLAAHAAAVPLL